MYSFYFFIPKMEFGIDEDVMKDSGPYLTSNGPVLPSLPANF